MEDEDIVYIDASHWTMQPQVMLEKLTAADIKFYTRKKITRRGRVKKEIASKNLRDISRVDFSLFEAYRDSRKSFLKKKNKGSKKTSKTKNVAEKASGVTPEANDAPLSQLNSCELEPKPVSSNKASEGEPPVKKPRKGKKKQDEEGVAKVPKPKKKAPAKKKSLKRRAMIIESDSDSSVENYGISYLNEKNNSDVPLQNHLHLNTLQSPTPFKNHTHQSSVQDVSKLMPSCPDVLVNEKDILSALEFGTEEMIYDSVMKDKYPNLGFVCKENNFTSGDFIYNKEKETDLTNRLALKENKVLSCLNQNLPGGRSSDMLATNLTSLNESLMADVKSKYGGEDMKDDFDVVSKIMQEMDQEFQARRKKSVTIAQAEQPSSKQPLNQEIGMKQSPTIVFASPQEVEVPPVCGPFVAKKSCRARVKNKKLVREGSFTEPNKNVDSVVKSVLSHLLNNVDKELNNCQSFPVNSRRVQKEMRICRICHCQYKPLHADAKNICQVCQSPVIKINPTMKNSLPLKQTWNGPSRSRGRPKSSGKYLKEDTGLLKSKFVKVNRGRKSHILKSFSSYDRRRLTYKNQLSSIKKTLSKTNSPAPDEARSTIPASSDNRNELKSAPAKPNIEVPPSKETNESLSSKTSNPKILSMPKFSTEEISRDDGGKTSYIKFSEMNRPVKSSLRKGTSKFSLSDMEKDQKQITPGSIQSQNSRGSEKGEFTVKPIKKGLYLMEFPDSDKELDLNDDPTVDDDEEKVPKKFIKKGLNFPDSTSVSPINDTVNNDLPPIPNFDSFQCRIVIPEAPTTVIVAQYDKSDFPSEEIGTRDFLLSNVSLTQGLTAYPVENSQLDNSNAPSPAPSLPPKNEKSAKSTVILPPQSAVVAPDAKSSLPVITNTMGSVSGFASDGENSPIKYEKNFSEQVKIKSAYSIPTDTSISTKDYPANAISDTIAETIATNTSVSVPEINAVANSSAANSTSVSTSSTTMSVATCPSSNQLERTELQNSDSINGILQQSSSLVVHELDAFAILCILDLDDLDGNVEHARKTLDNLLKKELMELRKITATSTSHLDNAISMKIRSTLGKIKSLNIARALLKRCRTLPKIIEAVLENTGSLEGENKREKSSESKYENYSESLLNIKTEIETKKAQDCLFASQEHNRETRMVPYVPQAPQPPSSYYEPEIPARTREVPQSVRSETTDYIVTEPPETPPIRVKSESSSSCMMSNCNKDSQSNSAENNYLSRMKMQLTNLNTTPPPSFEQIVPNLTEINQNQMLPVNNELQSTRIPSQQSIQQSLSPNSTQLLFSGRPGLTVSTMSNTSTSDANTVAVPSNSVSSNTTPKTQKSEINSFSCLLQHLTANGSSSNNNDDQSNRQQASNNNMTVSTYRAILPASAPEKQPCPNRTVPFNHNLQATLMNRSPSILQDSLSQPQIQFQGMNTSIYSTPASGNPVRVQQVVLSHLQPSNQSSNQNQLAVMPYNHPVQHQQQQQQPPPQLISSPLNCGGNVLVRFQVPQQQQQLQQQMQRQQQLQQQLQLQRQLQQQQQPNVYSASSSPQQLPVSPLAHAQVVPRSQNVRIAPAPPNSNQNSQLLYCVVCQKPANMRCKQCGTVVYCNTDCAKTYWNQRHKFECNPTNRMSS